MLFSFALIILCGLALSAIMQKMKLPSLLGLLLTGIILGPFVLDLLAPELLNISSDLRTISLIIILTRGGLALDFHELKKVGRPAILMSFVPATFEILATIVFAPLLFPISYPEAAIMGTVLAAVSPAIVVPHMLNVMESGYGKDKAVPQLILAGASADDIYVIILFTSFMGMYRRGQFDFGSLINIPISAVMGVLFGVILGLFLVKFFKKFHMRDTIKVLILLSVAFVLVSLEGAMQSILPMSGLLATVSLSAAIKQKCDILARRLSGKFSKIWVAAEIVLFVLIGAAVDISYALKEGFAAIALIFIALIFRTVGVLVSLIKSDLNYKERLFCAIAYLPKATVQAAIGALPLAAGIPAGNTILTVAVLAILVTAPLGALGINLSYKRLLTGPDKNSSGSLDSIS